MKKTKTEKWAERQAAKMANPVEKMFFEAINWKKVDEALKDGTADEILRKAGKL